VVHEETATARDAPATEERGGQRIFSALVIDTGLALRVVFRQPLRLTEGLLRSIADVLGIAISVPDHIALSRRGRGLTVLAKRIDNAVTEHHPEAAVIIPRRATAVARETTATPCDRNVATIEKYGCNFGKRSD
jgi:hypothetical protein